MDDGSQGPATGDSPIEETWSPGLDLEPGPSPARIGRLAIPFRSLRHRNYRLYFFGQLVSLTGTWMQMTALTWLAYQVTEESKWPAFISVSQILPTLFLGAWGGALSDRWPKRALIFWTQAALLVLALVLAVMVLKRTVVPWQLLVVTAASGVVQALDLPARLAFVMDMVGREDLINAVALNSLLFNVARALGPMLAGWLMGVLGPGECFLANAASYVAVLFALACMDVNGEPRPGARAAGGSLLDGVRFMFDKPGLGSLIVLAGVTALCGWPFATLLPALADGLHVGKEGYGVMLSGTGFGALAAALTVAVFVTPVRSQAFIAAGVFLVVIALVGLSVAGTLTEAVIYSGVIGYGLILFLATSQSVFQLSAGEHNRGRIMAIWAMTLSGAVPLGNLLAGPAADHWGGAVVLRCLALGLALAALALLVPLSPDKLRA